MINPGQSFFLDTIMQLRQTENILLHSRMIELSPEEEELVTEFLKREYETESLSYPFVAPAFNAPAALWAAKLVYLSALLILYREHKNEELSSILPVYAGEQDASAILSADLCLRFLPAIHLFAKMLDHEDQLAGLLHSILVEWPYAATGSGIEAKEGQELLPADDCLRQLYIDRIIEKKDLRSASMPGIREQVQASMGNYSTTFWKELK
ncbi:MAG: hypothetical protein JWO09_2765 [Bacteroidetes bacterium]|nr:hypothetical protein [Bacteroidota bacterium]